MFNKTNVQPNKRSTKLTVNQTNVLPNKRLTKLTFNQHNVIKFKIHVKIIDGSFKDNSIIYFDVLNHDLKSSIR